MNNPAFEKDFPTATEDKFTMEIDMNGTPIPADVSYCYIEVDGKAVVSNQEIDVDCWVVDFNWFYSHVEAVHEAIDRRLHPMEVIFTK